MRVRAAGCGLGLAGAGEGEGEGEGCRVLGHAAPEASGENAGAGARED